MRQKQDGAAHRGPRRQINLTERTAMLQKLLAGGLCGILGAQAVCAQERVANGTRFGEWTVLCEAVAVGETACYLAQEVVRLDTSATLAALLVVPGQDGEGQFLSIRAPQPVWLAAAMALRLPGAEEEIALAWQSCTAQYCEALIPLSQAQVTVLDVPEAALVGYRTTPGADALVFEAGFSGIGAGLTALVR